VIVGPARFSGNTALELGTAQHEKRKVPQGIDLGELKDVKQLAPAAAL